MLLKRRLRLKKPKPENAAYPRTVVKDGRGGNAQPINEELALRSEFPKNEAPIEYKIGINDIITFSKLIENNRSTDQIDSQWPTTQNLSNYKLGIGDTLNLKLIKQTKSDSQIAPTDGEGNQNLIITSQQIDETIDSTGRIGSDGSVLLLEVGRLDANGKSLSELRSEVRNILIRNGKSRFNWKFSNLNHKKPFDC